MESSEFQTLRGNFVAICRSISEPDLSEFSGELLQNNLVSYAGHQAAIAVNASSPANKIAHLVSEVMNSVSNSPDNFYNFVSILEMRNKQLSLTLKTNYLTRTREEQDQCIFATDFVTSLRQKYRTAQPPTWDPLPQCQHVKLAMIKEKGKRYGSDKMSAKYRVEGDVDELLTIKIPVDPDRIFDSGTFDDERQVILVEGVGGMGKTSLAYQYAKKWAEGKLNKFDAVALVHLRDLNEHDVCELDRILPHLLFLASGNSISREMAQRIIYKRKTLFILDGWDESPASIHKPLFLKNLQSVSPQIRILITSRPDFSLDLHGLTNRVEILGFTKSDIRDYIENVFKSHLPNSEVKSACDKLSSHFHRYPVIESCCYVPLNAAILAYIYLYRDQSLPITRCELFQELILCCIVRELDTRQPNRVLEDVSSFENLPADLKKKLQKLSEVAFQGVMENRIVFTQKELTSLSALGLLHSVQGFGSIGRKLVTYNFIHLAIQELLAAYYISRLKPAEHFKHFQTLLNDNLKLPVLQFYAGLTGLTNERVRNLITGFCFILPEKKSQFYLLAFLNCIFEAKLHDQSLNFMNRTINLSDTSLSPMDCLSVHYFLSYVAKKPMKINISGCNIDDHCLSMLLGISTVHAETSSVLGFVETIQMQGNKYTDTGIGYIARAVISSISLITLWVGNDSITSAGLAPLLEALPRQHTLKEVCLTWSFTQPDKVLKKIGESVGRSTLTILELYPSCPSLQSEEVTKVWIQDISFGGNSLIRSLECSQVVVLDIMLPFKNDFSLNVDSIKVQLLSSLQETVATVNSKRQPKSLPFLRLDFQFFEEEEF